MATQSSTFGQNIDIKMIEASNKELHDIISQINQYLYDFGHNWFLHAVAKSYFHKCSRSWVRVSNHLDKFLENPRNNYSLLMIVLEHELDKFPHQSFYRKKLISLHHLVSMGPNFSITSKYH